MNGIQQKQMTATNGWQWKGHLLLKVAPVEWPEEASRRQDHGGA